MSTLSGRRWVLAIVGLVVIAAVTLVAAGVVNRGGDSAADTAPTTGDRLDASQRLVPDTPPADGVTLPEGGDVIDGYPVRFPYSDLGAAAAAAAVSRAQIGFDYQQATQVAGIYAAPVDRAALEGRSREAVASRRQQAGVPPTGNVPAPASYAATPIAFTIDDLAPDYYAVDVLSYITLTHVDGQAGDTWYAGTQLVRWVDGDWKLVDGTPAQIQSLIDQGRPQAAAPGTPAYRQSGWIPIRGANA